MERRIDTVSILLDHGTVGVPWRSRTMLLDRVFYSVRARFEAVGMSRPLELTADEKSYLVRVIDDWAAQPGELPAGIHELRDALHDDLSGAA
jgi:hypothetical protein